MMILFLEEVSCDFKEYSVIMLVDETDRHRSRGLTIPENLRLIQHPSHSAKLNPVEPLWGENREKVCPNRVFKSLRDVEHALCYGMGRLQNDPKRLRSLMNVRHPIIPC